MKKKLVTSPSASHEAVYCSYVVTRESERHPESQGVQRDKVKKPKPKTSLTNYTLRKTNHKRNNASKQDIDDANCAQTNEPFDGIFSMLASFCEGVAAPARTKHWKQHTEVIGEHKLSSQTAG